MPIARNDIERLLEELDREPGDAVEDQSVDFKEWYTSSDHQSVRLAVVAAVYMANGGGGTVVFGVRDTVPMRMFVADEAGKGVTLATDQLFVLTHFVREAEINSMPASRPGSATVGGPTHVGFLSRWRLSWAT